jgi:hypothetical protein
LIAQAVNSRGSRTLKTGEFEMDRRLIIDANLLLLLVIGAVEEGRHISNSKRLNAFDRADYDFVLNYMSEYDQVFITPYIATEVSNLIDLNGYARKLAYEIAQVLFSSFQKIDVSVDDDCAPDFFPMFGITDSSLIRLAPHYHVLTNDDRLFPLLFQVSPNTIVPYAVVRGSFAS